MIVFGIYCLVTGAAVAFASRRSLRHRALFEMMGGGLVLAGLGFTGAGFILVA
ncbi:MAG: hypothetical protein INR70_06265 [Parafilimonas terrae]|nr:hypothetical protein [Parafilimonas terrae]